MIVVHIRIVRIQLPRVSHTKGSMWITLEENAVIIHTHTIQWEMTEQQLAPYVTLQTRTGRVLLPGILAGVVCLAEGFLEAQVIYWQVLSINSW